MPIYEYKCRSCQSLFETLIRNEQDEKELTCPRCAGKELERQLSVFAGNTGGDLHSSGSSCIPSKGFS